MISAQNLLRPLNGSNLRLWTWLLVLSLVACKTVKAPADSGNKQVPLPKEIEKTKPTPAEKGKTSDVEFWGNKYTVPRFENNFKVALVLPFMLDLPEPDKNALARIMMDYYEGLRIAAGELEKEGIMMQLHIFDTKNDTNELKKVLARNEMKSMNMIIGPVLRPHLNIISSFSRSSGIPVISPLTSHTELPAENPYYYNCASSDKTKATALANYIAMTHPGVPLYIIHDDSKTDKLYSEVFREVGKENNFKIHDIKYVKKMEEIVDIKSKDSILVFLPSNDQFVVNWCMGKLIARQNVMLFGVDDWLEMTNNDYNFWELHKVHLATSHFINMNDSDAMWFRQQYIGQYKSEPSQFAYQAYDQMMFFGEALLAFGPNFGNYIKDTRFDYSQGAFYFINNGRCNENYGVTILKFEDYELKPAE